MRTENDIKRRLQQRRFRHQKKYLEAVLGRDHANCRHNARAETSASGIGGVHVCTHPSVTRSSEVLAHAGRIVAKRKLPSLPICDRSVQQDKSSNCPHFENRTEKEQAKKDFTRIVYEASQDMDRFAGIWPDMAQLIWVLSPDAGEVPSEVVQGAPVPEAEADPAPTPNPPDLELRAAPGASLVIGEAGRPQPTALDLPSPGDEGPPPGILVRFLRWLLRKVERG